MPVRRIAVRSSAAAAAWSGASPPALAPRRSPQSSARPSGQTSSSQPPPAHQLGGNGCCWWRPLLELATHAEPPKPPNPNVASFLASLNRSRRAELCGKTKMAMAKRRLRGAERRAYVVAHRPGSEATRSASAPALHQRQSLGPRYDVLPTRMQHRWQRSQIATPVAKAPTLRQRDRTAAIGQLRCPDTACGSHLNARRWTRAAASFMTLIRGRET